MFMEPTEHEVRRTAIAAYLAVHENITTLGISHPTAQAGKGNVHTTEMPGTLTK